MSVLALDSVGLRDGMADRTFCVFSSVGDGRDSADIWPSSTRSAAGRSGNRPVVLRNDTLEIRGWHKKKQFQKSIATYGDFRIAQSLRLVYVVRLNPSISNLMNHVSPSLSSFSIWNPLPAHLSPLETSWCFNWGWTMHEVAPDTRHSLPATLSGLICSLDFENNKRDDENLKLIKIRFLFYAIGWTLVKVEGKKECSLSFHTTAVKRQSWKINERIVKGRRRNGGHFSILKTLSTMGSKCGLMVVVMHGGW